MEITIAKQAALAKLEEHRQRHIVEYKEQFKGWQEAMQVHGDELKNWASDHSDERQPSAPPRPTNYLKQYQDLIQKLTYHVHDSIAIDEHEFDEIINDKFGWTGGFLLNNGAYASGSLSADRTSSLGTSRAYTGYAGASVKSGSFAVSNNEDHVEVE